MPVTQVTLNFPERKTRSSSTKKRTGRACSPPHLVQADKSAAPASRSRRASAVLATASIAYSVAVDLSEDEQSHSPEAHRRGKKTPVKRRLQGLSATREELCSPSKSPRHSSRVQTITVSNPLVSPLKLRLVSKNNFVPVKKVESNTRNLSSTRGSGRKAKQSQENPSTPEDKRSSTTPKKTRRTNESFSESIHDDDHSDDESCLEQDNVPPMPFPSPAAELHRSPLKPFNNHLDSEQLQLKLNTIAMRDASPTAVTHRQTRSPWNSHRDKENTPVKQRISCQVSSPLMCNAGTFIRSPLRSCKKITFDDDMENVSRSSPCKSDNITSPIRTSKVISKDIIKSPFRRPGSKGVLGENKLATVLGSPVKTPTKCMLSRGILSELSSPGKSPLRRLELDAAHALHPRSPLKQLQKELCNDTSSSSSAVDRDLLSPTRRSPRKPCSAPRAETNPSGSDTRRSPGKPSTGSDAEPTSDCCISDVRRSPRKHAPSSLATLSSPIRKLTLEDGSSSGGVIKLHKPDVSSYQALKRALAHGSNSSLVGREEEVDTITSFLSDRLQHSQPGALYISGAPGTGKTAALTQILNTMPAARKLTPVWVNCMGLHSSTAVYRRIASDLGLPAQPTELKTLKVIERYLSGLGSNTILVLDEIDQLETRHQAVLYTLFEWPALHGSKLLLLAIANRLDLTERVLPRLASNTSCAPDRLHFAPYSKQQILSIITDRLNKSGVPWRGIVRPPALQLLAGKVASVAGDARRALDVCRRAVDTCQANLTQTTLAAPVPGAPATSSVVDVALVLRLFNEVYGSRVVTALTAAPATFPIQQKVLLCCFLLIHKHAKNKQITMGKLQEVYTRVCSNRQVPTVDGSEFQSLCSLLQTRAMIDIAKSKDARMAKVSLRLNADEAERALGDRELMLQIMEDREALGRLAKKNKEQ